MALVPRLRAALVKLNPTLPPEAIAASIDELTRNRPAMLLEQANREVYLLLKEGIKVSLAERDSTPGNTSSGLRPPSPQRGEGKAGQTTVRLRVIDWEQPANHDFLLVSQFSVTGALYTCRPDLVGFVNPDSESGLVVIELKKPGVPARGLAKKRPPFPEVASAFWGLIVPLRRRRRGRRQRFLLPLRGAFDVAGALPGAQFLRLARVFVVHDGVQFADFVVKC